jgi:RNA polymerase sigma factor (sigma-70 family)
MARRRHHIDNAGIPGEFSSTNPILARLVREIGTHECMDKTTMFGMFHEVDDLYTRALRQLATHSRYLDVALANRVAEVAGGLTQGRVIHSLPHSGREDPAWGRHKHFLFSAMSTLGRRLLDDEQSAEQFTQQVQQLQIVGSIKLQLLRDYAKHGQEYLRHSEALARQLVELAPAHAGEELRRHQGQLLLDSPAGRELQRLAEVLATSEDNVPALTRLATETVQRIERIHERLFNHHLRLLIKVSNSLTIDPDQILDNFQAGSFGLMRAIRDYVPPFNFIGYASQWIRQAVLGVVRSYTNNIRIPGNVLQEFNNLERARQRLATDATIEEIAAEADVDPKRAARVYELITMSHTFSLDRSVSGLDGPPHADGAIALIDTLADPDANSDGVDTPTQQVLRYMDCLDPRERWVVSGYFGLYDYLPDTVGDTRDVREGAERERLRQALIAALAAAAPK